MNQYQDMPDDYLKKTYVPDVYQKTIFSIDYEQLKSAGIKLISFDIDDTIVPRENHNPTKAAITLFEKLKLMGFELILLSNANDDRVKRFGQKLGVNYIPRAAKPHITHFEELRTIYKNKYGLLLETQQMVHIGNNITTDVAGGNTFGVTTCLVRNIGIFPSIARKTIPGKSEGKKLRMVLKERGIWRKHHLNYPDDQYYQLEDTPLAQNSK